ncbi:hypothetical protein F5Y16DRAFT_199052 [Xylariaceae sp. FL0255]|nr:hypothetical protein F5Y16DRAFT_199052 [Xylariaceae sp. FL0255]
MDVQRPKASIFRQWTGNIAFAMSEAQIHHAIQMVTRHQTSLRMLLQAQVGRDMIVLSREIGYIKVDVHNVEHTLANTSKIIQQASTDISKSMRLRRKIEMTQRAPRSIIDVTPSGFSFTGIESARDPDQRGLQRQISPSEDLQGSGQQNHWQCERIRSIQGSFNIWSESKRTPVTPASLALNAVSLELGPGGNFNVSFLPDEPAKAALPLMLAEEPLESVVLAFDEEFSPGSCIHCVDCAISLDEPSRRCVLCASSNARWFLACIRSLLNAAHLASVRGQSLPIDATDAMGLVKLPELPPQPGWDEPIIGRDEKKKEQRTLTRVLTSGTLFAQLDHLMTDEYEINMLKFAFATNFQTSTSSHGIIYSSLWDKDRSRHDHSTTLSR